jgi:hypothetical protein
VKEEKEAPLFARMIVPCYNEPAEAKSESMMISRKWQAVGSRKEFCESQLTLEDPQIYRINIMRPHGESSYWKKQGLSLSQVSVEDANKKKKLVDSAAIAWMKRSGSEMMLSVIGTFIYRLEEVDKRTMTRALRARGMTHHGY